MVRIDPPSLDREGRRATEGRWVMGPIGLLAIQGSFALHARSLARLGVPCREVRKREDLIGIRGLILPGGESTTMSLLMQKYGLFEPLRRMGLEGFPLFGTCAGAILLGRGEGIPRRLELVPVELRRNAYGTQLDSFSTTLSLKPFREPFHGVFIRAPKIVEVGSPEAVTGPGAPKGQETGAGRLPEVEVLGEHEGVPVLVASGSCLLSTFHPELTDDLRIHRLFLERFVGPGSKDTTLAVEGVAAR